MATSTPGKVKAAEKLTGIEVSIAIAETVSACEPDAIAAYPITPQTHIVEHLSEIVADGHLDAAYIPVESEHSAMSACCGTVAAGARTFTATSSQGLALMHEILFIASGLRLPMVMAVANRALSAPISIWNDHGDVMSDRDCGWIQTFAENGQEACDLILHAFRVSEDPSVMLPVMVNFDGFIVSHMIEPIAMIAREQARAYLPPFAPQVQLNPLKPCTIGPVGIPEIYTETRVAHEHALRQSKDVVKRAFDEFARQFGRQYQVVERYRCDDTPVRFVIMGGTAETCMTAVDRLREQGEQVGIVRLRLWRPFPFEEFYEAVAGAKVLIVVDRALSTGGPGGPLASELKSALYGRPEQPRVVEFIAGLGGRDMPPRVFTEMYQKAKPVLGGASVPPFEIVGVRS